MRYPQLLLMPLAFVCQVRAQVTGLSSTAVVTCLTKLGTTSGAVPLPTSSNLRSLTVDTIQKSTFTPTATSTPPDSTMTLTSTEFPTTTTTLPNTIIDTFYSTSTIVNAVTTTNTVTVTDVFTTSFTTTTIPPTYTSPAPPGFTDATDAQNIEFADTPGLYGYYPNRKRALNGALAARAAVSSAPTSPQPSSDMTEFEAFVYPEAVSCTGIVEYYSTKTSVVSTAPTYTVSLPKVEPSRVLPILYKTTLVPITDTTSTTETTTITSSVLATEASTTSTVMTTITTTNVAPAVTQTTTQTASRTVTVSGVGPTAYAACANNNLLTTVNGGRYAISQVEPYTGMPSSGRYLTGAKTVISASSAYACCVAQFSGVYTTQSFGAYYIAATQQCMIVTVGSSGASCNAGAPSLEYFGTPTYGTGIAFTVISGTCGYPRIEFP